MKSSDLRLYFVLQIAAHQIKKAADGRLKSHAGLTTAQAAVLAIVASRAPVSQRLVARELRQNDSAMTAMVARLMKLGYLDRLRSRADERSWDLSVTRAGRSALEAARPAFAEINDVLEKTFSDAELAELATQLAAIAEAFAETDE